MFKKMLPVFLTLGAAQAHATNCSDNIITVTAHSNGNVYFNTETVCSAHWCVLGKEKWNTTDKLKNGLAVLLSAKATGNPVVIEWDPADVPDCSTVLNHYATPGFILLK